MNSSKKRTETPLTRQAVDTKKRKTSTASATTAPCKKLAISIIQKPVVSKIQEPAVSMVPKPPVSIAQKPPVSTVQKPHVSTIQKPALSVVQKPALSMIQKPAVSMIHKPALSVVQQPAVSMIQKPPVSMVQKPPVSMVQKPPFPMIQKPAVSMIQKPAVSMIQKPPVSMIQKPPVSMIHKPALSVVQKPALSMIQKPAVSMVQKPPVSMIQKPAVSKKWTLGNPNLMNPLSQPSTSSSYSHTMAIYEMAPNFELNEAIAASLSDKEGSQNFLDRMTIKFLYETGKHGVPGEECPICYIKYDVNHTLRRLPCLHYFHSGCVDDWLTHHWFCPLCRVSLMSSNDHSEDSSEDELEFDGDDFCF